MGILDRFFGKKPDVELSNSKELEWFNIGSIEDLENAIEYSYSQPALIFKHSTRCSISASAIDRLKRNWDGDQVSVRAFYLDLLNNRDVSTEITTRLHVEHQSPQMIIIKEGVAVYNASHTNIDFDDVKIHAPKK